MYKHTLETPSVAFGSNNSLTPTNNKSYNVKSEIKTVDKT